MKNEAQTTKLLKTIDVFGVPVTMNFFGRPKSNSKAGGVFSLFLLAFYGWTIYTATEDLFSRSNPNTNHSELYNDDPPEMILSETNFPFGFQVQDPNDKPFIDDTIYNLTVFHTYTETTNENETLKFNETRTKIQTERCRQEHFGNLAPRYNISIILPTHCIALNQTNLDRIRRIQGAYGSPVTQGLRIQISECNNDTSPIPCAPRERIHSMMSGGWFGVIYPNMVVNLGNLTNPDSKYPDSSYFVIDPNILKSIQILVGYVDVVTDAGWVTKSLETQKFLKVNDIKETSQPQRADHKLLVDFYIDADKLAYHYSRTFKKVQDALATIGGIMNTSFLVLILITTPYFRYKYKETLMHELYDVPESDCEALKYQNVQIGRLLVKSKNSKKPSSLPDPKVEHATEMFPLDKTRSKLKRTAIGEVKKVENKVNSSSAKNSKKDLNLCSLPEVSQPLRVPMKNSTFDNLERNSLKNIDYKKPLKGNFEAIKSPNSPRIDSKRKFANKDSPLISENSVGIDVNLSHKSEEPDYKIINLHDLNIFSKEDPQAENQINSAGKNQEKQSPSPEDIQKSESHASNGVVEANNSPKADQNPDQSPTLALENGDNKEKITKDCKNDDDDDEYYDEDDDDDENNPEEDNQNKEPRVKLTLWEYVYSFIYKTDNLKRKMELIDKGIAKVDKQIDIVYIVKKLQELDKLKLLVLGRARALLFHYLPKTDVLTLKKRVRGERLPFSYHLKRLSFDQQAPKKVLAEKAYKKLNKTQKKSTLDQWILRAYKN